VNNEAVAHESDVVLKLGTDVGHVECATNFENNMGAIGDLQSHVVVAAADVASAASVAVASGHGHRALRVSENGDSQRSIGVETM